MEWKLTGPGVWECPGTKVTVKFEPLDPVPYEVFWDGNTVGCAGHKDAAFKRAVQFIRELTEAGIDA
jgi:hypothetical protein